MKSYEKELKEVAISLLLEEKKLDRLQKKHNISNDQIMVDLDQRKCKLSPNVLGY